MYLRIMTCLLCLLDRDCFLRYCINNVNKFFLSLCLQCSYDIKNTEIIIIVVVLIIVLADAIVGHF